MCGICGICHDSVERPIERPILQEMNDSLIHRGPDGEGLFVEGNIGLGHRRLSIIDLEGGDQPIFNEDRSIAIVFNGEIYNYKGDPRTAAEERPPVQDPLRHRGDRAPL